MNALRLYEGREIKHKTHFHDIFHAFHVVNLLSSKKKETNRWEKTIRKML